MAAMEKPTPGCKVCVFGSGSFGTALGTVIARNGFAVTMITRREEVITSINIDHKNPVHLSDFKLPPLLSATSSAKDAIAGAKYIVHCIPVQASEAYLEPLKDLIDPSVPIISTSKGLHSETLETMAELLPRVLGKNQRTAFFSGPTFAKELMEGYPSAAVMASGDTSIADSCAGLFHSNAVRMYTSDDVIGVEIGGALKNVYALAAGVIEGMGLGVNPTAFMVTRACAEMNMIAVAMGARAHTMSGLSGIGDLMLTCMGGASRNKAVGQRIGKGESLKDIMDSRAGTLAGVAEGVATAPAAAQLVKKTGIDAPLITAVAAVLDGKVGTHEAILKLMQRPRNEDFSSWAMKAQLQREQEEASKLFGLPGQTWAFVALAQTAVIGFLAWKMSRRA